MRWDRTVRSLRTFFFVALFAHLGIGAALGSVLPAPEPVNKSRKLSVVDLETPPPAPPPVVQPIPQPAVQHEPPPPPIVHHIAVREPPPPPPAPPPPAPTRAAPLMTVTDEYSNDQDTVAVGDNPNATGDVSNNGVMRSQGVQGARFGGTGNGGGTGPAHVAPPAPPAIDYSTHAQSHCDEDAARSEFPEEAREQGISEMDVRMRVSVDSNGHVARIVALNDPGYGFVTAAERVIRSHCDIRPATDHSGAHVADVIQTFTVHFVME